MASFVLHDNQGPMLLRQKTYPSPVDLMGHTEWDGGAGAGAPARLSKMHGGGGAYSLSQKTESSMSLAESNGGAAGGGSARASTIQKGHGGPRLLKQKTESSIILPGEGGGPEGGPARISLIRKGGLLKHAAAGQELTGSSSRNQNGSIRSMQEASSRSGGGGEKPAKRRPQRYHKIKMKSPPGNDRKNTIGHNIIKKEHIPKGEKQPYPNKARDWPAKLTGGTFSALAVAHKVASGFRGDPDWATGVSRSAHRR